MGKQRSQREAAGWRDQETRGLKRVGRAVCLSSRLPGLSEAGLPLPEWEGLRPPGGVRLNRGTTKPSDKG